MSAPPFSSELAADLATLETLNIDGVRALWRERFGDDPPRVQTGDFLRFSLAERLQMQVFGRDRDLEQRLAKLVRARRRGESVQALRPTYRPGTRLTREHGGVLHHVDVLERGFRWDGREWKSLSEIARVITGVRWNGPRFFGLRDEPAAKPPAKAVRR